jgi:hypothetical protein
MSLSPLPIPARLGNSGPGAHVWGNDEILRSICSHTDRSTILGIARVDKTGYALAMEMVFGEEEYYEVYEAALGKICDAVSR